jgi:hypothetical protein
VLSAPDMSEDGDVKAQNSLPTNGASSPKGAGVAASAGAAHDSKPLGGSQLDHISTAWTGQQYDADSSQDKAQDASGEAQGDVLGQPKAAPSPALQHRRRVVLRVEVATRGQARLLTYSMWVVNLLFIGVAATLLSSRETDTRVGDVSLLCCLRCRPVCSPRPALHAAAPPPSSRSRLRVRLKASRCHVGSSSSTHPWSPCAAHPAATAVLHRRAGDWRRLPGRPPRPHPLVHRQPAARPARAAHMVRLRLVGGMGSWLEPKQPGVAAGVPQVAAPLCSVAAPPFPAPPICPHATPPPGPNDKRTSRVPRVWCWRCKCPTRPRLWRPLASSFPPPTASTR